MATTSINTILKRLLFNVLLLLMLLLTACGGGSGGGGGSSADTTVPVIILAGTNPVNIEVNTTYVDAGATASDNIDGDITANITTTSTVDTSNVATYSVTYNVSDAAGNAATEVVRTVNVTIPVSDNNFNIGTGMNFYVNCIATATDGSGDVYVGGQFTTVNGTASVALVRMNSDGTVDTDFNVFSSMSGSVESIAPATDGSGDVYVGGHFTAVNGVTTNRLVRMNSDGTVDTGFNIGTGMNNTIFSIAPAIDGSGDVYVGGDFNAVKGVTTNRLVRMNSNGTVDTGFNIGTGMNNSVRSIVPSTDGSSDVYVGGIFTSVNGVTANHLVRMNSNGTVDTGFNVGAGMDSSVQSIASATDGSGDVYVGGTFTTVNGIGSNRLVRMNSDGTVDSGFDIGTGMNNAVWSIAPATDGSSDVYVGGYFTTVNFIASNHLVRMNSDGTVDTGFNIGTGMNGPSGIVYSISPAIDGSGDVYVGGLFTDVNGTPSNYLVGMNPDGTVE